MGETFAIRVRDGTPLAAERHGADGGAPPILLLHAGVADRRAWRGVAPALAACGARVVAYDRRGFGETDGDPGRSFRHADDLVDVLGAVAGGPAWLVGNSQGGRIALDVALEAPERVAGLVLLAPAVSGAPEIEDDDLDDAGRELSAAIDRAYEAGDLDALNRLEVRLWLDGAAGPEGRVGGATRDLALDMNRVALHSGMPEGAGEGGQDAWSRLEELRVPATIAWGTLDLAPLVDRCRMLAERLPDVREVVTWPGVAHLPSLEVPGDVAELVARAAGL